MLDIEVVLIEKKRKRVFIEEEFVLLERKTPKNSNFNCNKLKINFVQREKTLRNFVLLISQTNKRKLLVFYVVWNKMISFMNK